MSHLLPRCLLALAVTVLALWVPSPDVGLAAQSAHAAGACSIPHQGEHLGPTYLTYLSVSNTSCGTGLTVVREYHSCQLKHGGAKAKCPTPVDGFSCTEQRGPAIATEFFSTVSCKSGSRRVSYKYTQFT